MILESLSFTQSLYAFDFDGTLSKIVRVPADAVISEKTGALLRELSEFVPVAIVSGRSVDDLRQRLPFEPFYLVGNHGLEGLGGSRESLVYAETVCRGWRDRLEKIDFGVGVEVEDKSYSLAIHFRRSRKKKEANAKIRRALRELDPAPRVISGKSVVNLIPAGAPHKGVALMELMKMAGTRRAFYIGDDDTDEDVFGLPDDQVVMSVRVGKKKSSSARYYIRHQSEINQVLKVLIQFHRPHKPAHKNSEGTK